MAWFELIVQQLSNPAVLITVLISCVLTFHRLTKAPTPSPKNLPWVGKKSRTFFAETVASLSALNNAQLWLTSGYEKYSKNGKSYIIPCFFKRPEVVLPPSSIKWFLDQPDNVISVHDVHNDRMHPDYITSDPRVMNDPFQIPVLYKYVPRRAAACVAEINDEVTKALPHVWGTDTTSWNDIAPWTSTMRIISRVSNRTFMGEKICREDAFLDAVVRYASMYVPMADVLGMFPRFMYPVVGPLVQRPLKTAWRKSSVFSIPVIEERLQNFARKEEDPSFEWEAPNDWLTWHITEAYLRKLPQELDAELISHRLLSVNFASIHTTAITLTNCMFDLFSSPQSAEYVPALREELIRVYREEGNQWTNNGLSRLYRVDSAIRESMRISSLFSTGLLRKVVAPQGVVNQAEGYTIPKDTHVSVDVWNIHHDPEYYPEPSKYDALRFSQPREEYEALATEAKSSATTLKMKNLSVVTTGDKFLGFAHGRHACPGRFFVAIELKLILAHLLLEYDVEPLKVRPQNKWLGGMVLPPMKATMKIKRREVPLV